MLGRLYLQKLLFPQESTQRPATSPVGLVLCSFDPRKHRKIWPRQAEAGQLASQLGLPSFVLGIPSRTIQMKEASSACSIVLHPDMISFKGAAQASKLNLQFEPPPQLYWKRLCDSSAEFFVSVYTAFLLLHTNNTPHTFCQTISSAFSIVTGWIIQPR